MKYTQGKWLYSESSNDVDYLIHLEGAEPFFMSCNYGVDPKYIDKEQTEANAKLITAAPDLLQSLYQIISLYEQLAISLPPILHEMWYKEAKEAIKKATE
jgi:hypothetical protein